MSVSYLSVCLFYLSQIYLSLILSLFILSRSISASLCLSVSAHLSLLCLISCQSFSVCLFFFSLSPYIFVSQFLCFPVSLSIYLSICLRLCLSVSVSLFLYLSLHVCLLC